MRRDVKAALKVSNSRLKFYGQKPRRHTLYTDKVVIIHCSLLNLSPQLELRSLDQKWLQSWAEDRENFFFFSENDYMKKKILKNPWTEMFIVKDRGKQNKI